MAAIFHNTVMPSQILTNPAICR